MSEKTSSISCNIPVDEEPTQTSTPDPEAAIDRSTPIPKTRSCEDLASASKTAVSTEADMGPRRLSDPSLAAAAAVAPATATAALDTLNNQRQQQQQAEEEEEEDEERKEDSSSAVKVDNVNNEVVPAVTNGVVDESIEQQDDSITPSQDNGEQVGQEENICDNEDDELSKEEEEERKDNEDSKHKAESSSLSMRITGRSSVEGSTETLTGCLETSCSRNTSHSTLSASPASNNTYLPHQEHHQTNGGIRRGPVFSNMVAKSTSTSDISTSDISKIHTDFSLSSAIQSLYKTSGRAALNAPITSGLHVDIARCQSSGQNSDSEASGSPSPAVENKVRTTNI